MSFFQFEGVSSINNFLKKIKEGIIIGDGAMGTLLQTCGLSGGYAPESWVLERPEIIKNIHQDYIGAGAGMVETNTFGANGIKLQSIGLEDKIVEINRNAVKLAREVAKDKLVAGSVGPTGKLMKPHGDLAFLKAKEVFKEQINILVESGVDVIIIETMSDLQEIRAAVIAAKEIEIPVIAQMTFTERMVTLTGSTPEVVAIVLDSLGVDVIGVNCTPGSKETLPIIKKMASVTDRPLSVFPNAGLPQLNKGEIIYPETIKDFIKPVKKFLEYNVRLMGGCCGTTPDYIRSLTHEVERYQGLVSDQKRIVSKGSSYLTSNHTHIEINHKKPVYIIGERINPTNREDLKKALMEERWDIIREEAKKQVIAGAGLLDVNIGVQGIDKVVIIKRLVKELQLEVDVPLVIDSTDYSVLEAALQEYTGKPLINSVNGDYRVMERIFDLAKKYGAAVLGLTLDEKGIPSTVEGRFNIAKRIVDVAQKYGIDKRDIYIDTLVLTAGSNQGEIVITLDTLKRVKKELRVNTVLGISNVSHGLPYRSLINETFLAMALASGLDLPIVNPLDERVQEIIRSSNLLTGRDKDARDYIRWYKGVKRNKSNGFRNKDKQSKDILNRVQKKIIDGESQEINTLLEEAISYFTPQEIIDKGLIPGIRQVGELYDKGIYFLPQLMESARVVEDAFDYIKHKLLKNNSQVKKKGSIILATVSGDIHDIGKNIAKVIFSNYGFDVIDLGANVDTEVIVRKALENKVHFVGLSALMTVTMENMREVVEELHKNGFQGGIIIGGAVTSEEFALEIGADLYARDALDGVRKVEKYLGY